MTSWNKVLFTEALLHNGLLYPRDMWACVIKEQNYGFILS